MSESEAKKGRRCMGLRREWDRRTLKKLDEARRTLAAKDAEIARLRELAGDLRAWVNDWPAAAKKAMERRRVLLVNAAAALSSTPPAETAQPCEVCGHEPYGTRCCPKDAALVVREEARPEENHETRMAQDAGPGQRSVLHPLPDPAVVRDHPHGHGRPDGAFVPAVGPAVVAPSVEETPTLLPACHVCGKPATCIGRYEDPEGPIQPACDDCCGHGNEDGHCERILAPTLPLIDPKPIDLMQALKDALAKRALPLDHPFVEAAPGSQLFLHGGCSHMVPNDGWRGVSNKFVHCGRTESAHAAPEVKR